ncbi:MAG: HAMP domain-containing sensor histidine kinase [Saprospiraceae bacterium]|nr:HAMP domain-containing sensor histidine kinase [Saprospiraceae bacterium]HNL38510.1 HAMP domain-containing sensor histidine kinase [Saprospiraceae bacterium]
MQNKNRPGAARFVGLIVSSLALLAVFQAFWLHKVWDEQKEAYRQEADNVFQRTVMVLQDSLTRRAMRRSGVSPDSCRFPMPPILFGSVPRNMQLPPKTRAFVRSDTASFRFESDKKSASSQVQIYISTVKENPDAAPGPLPGLDRIISHVDGSAEMGAEDHFVFKLEQDSLDENELRSSYAERLQAAGLPVRFELIRMDDREPPDSTIFGTLPAHTGLLTHTAYLAAFPDYKGYIFQKTLPYGLFSLLLFGITATAFGAIWKSLRRQQRLAKLKNDFIANITHELKTPITTVGVALEALSDFDARRDPVRSREYLDISKLELERLSLLVDKVLRLSMFEQQEPRMRMENLNLADVLRPVLGALRLQAERRGARIEFLQAEGQDFTVRGDRMHLSSVVFNLLDNALKYTPGQPQVRVGLLSSGGQVRLSVRDNGPGIPAAFRDKVFEKFFRVPAQGSTHDVKGHGLGLSYAQEVARLHGGHIELAPAEEQGCTFTLVLPAANSQEG